MFKLALTKNKISAARPSTKILESVNSKTYLKHKINKTRLINIILLVEALFLESYYLCQDVVTA